MPKIDTSSVPSRKGSGYPSPFDEPCAARTRRRLGNAGDLRDFGVNLMTLPPGSWSSQRHWHSHEDEFVYLLEGELVLIEDGSETVLHPGDCALPLVVAERAGWRFTGSNCRIADVVAPAVGREAPLTEAGRPSVASAAFRGLRQAKQTKIRNANGVAVSNSINDKSAESGARGEIARCCTARPALRFRPAPLRSGVQLGRGRPSCRTRLVRLSSNILEH